MLCRLIGARQNANPEDDQVFGWASSGIYSVETGISQWEAGISQISQTREFLLTGRNCGSEKAHSCREPHLCFQQDKTFNGALLLLKVSHHRNAIADLGFALDVVVHNTRNQVAEVALDLGAGGLPEDTVHLVGHRG